MDTYQSEHLRTQDYAPFFSFLALTKIVLKTLEKCTREKTRLERLDEETVERETEAGRKTRDEERRAQRRGEKVTAVREAVGKLEGRRARKEVLAGRTRGARPELDRIGELVITEAGDSPERNAGLPRAST